MMDFKGFEDWIEVFRGGRQKDSAGREHDGDGLIGKAVETFNASEHEPPVVIGHPKDNAPAFGWVEGLKAGVKDGASVLFAKLHQVAPEFEGMVKRGLFKKRSASFYPDGRLRHIGFLGASPPAVKGLQDVAFNNQEDHFDFDGPENTVKGTGKEQQVMDVKEFIEALKFWEKSKQELATVEEKPIEEVVEETPAGFTEADLETAKEEAAKAEREKVETEFAEKAAQDAQDARQREVSEWYDSTLKDGKIPAWNGLKEFALSLDAVNEFEFNETKTTQLQQFQGFMESLGKLVDFKETATRDKDVEPSGDPQGQLIELANARAEKDSIGFQEAMLAVGRENPEMVREMMNTNG